MIRSLINICYNGKIDNDADSQRLASLIDRIMVPETFDENFDILSAVSMKSDDKGANSGDQMEHSLTLPSTTNWSTFEDWTNHLPEREPPGYLGLPDNAEKLLLVQHGREMLGNVNKVMRVLDESEQTMAE